LIDEIPEYIPENCIVRIGDKIIPVGIEGMKQHMIEVRKTYPDLKMTIIRLDRTNKTEIRRDKHGIKMYTL
jgi:hypothetical protein